MYVFAVHVGSKQYSGLFQIILDLIKNDFLLLRFAFLNSGFLTDFFYEFQTIYGKNIKRTFQITRYIVNSLKSYFYAFLLFRDFKSKPVMGKKLCQVWPLVKLLKVISKEQFLNSPGEIWTCQIVQNFRNFKLFMQISAKE